MRRYRGFIADSARWEEFELRDDDVIISTPAKCGTTWMQNIVGMLLLDRPVLGVPIGEVSPWLDMLIRTDEEVFELLASQRHRRWIKTHTPLDGVPYRDTVTYIAVARHPLDAALSDRDHGRNIDMDRTRELRHAAVGEVEPPAPAAGQDAPEDPTEFLRWFIDNDLPATGSGPNGLSDYCEQIATYWDSRTKSNVHLFHYDDLWNHLDAEMRRVASALAIRVDESRWPEFVDGATLDSMRSRSGDTAPEAHLDMWQDADHFFRVGSTRDWASLLDADDLAHFGARLAELAGPAAPWILAGRSALE